MKISKYLVSYVVRFVMEETPGSPPTMYIGDLVNALKDRYRFLQVPTKIEEFDLQKGIEFIHGIFEKDQVIRKLRIHNNGIFCEAVLSTEVISDFIEDVFNWARQEIGMKLEDAVDPNQFFSSHLEVETDISLATAFSKFSLIGDKLTTLVASYGQQVPSFEATTLAFQCDLSKVQNISPEMFTFERRAQKPFDSGLFYSAAPLKTADHLELLNELEGILAS